MKALDSLKCFKSTLSYFLIDNCYFASYGSFSYWYIIFFHVFSCNYIKVNYIFYCFGIFLYLISSFLCMISFVVSCAYVSLLSIDHITEYQLIVRTEYNFISLTSSEDTLSFSLQIVVAILILI